MKTFVKTTIISATALAMTTFGVPQARAHGWAVAAGVLGGLTAGTIIGASVASAATPVYYSYPAPVYYTPAPAAAVAPAALPPYAGYASYASSPTYPAAAATASGGGAAACASLFLPADGGLRGALCLSLPVFLSVRASGLLVGTAVPRVSLSPLVISGHEAGSGPRAFASTLREGFRR